MTAPAPTVPCLPESAPFSAEQRAWLNGFFAGMFSRQSLPGDALPAAAAPVSRPLTILWGSQTGTAERLAKQAAKTAGQRGFAATVQDMAGYDPKQLPQAGNVLVITSTYGDGEPPDNARTLHAALREAKESLDLAGARFAVCGLGDSNYTLFCQCGKDFDEALATLGGRRVVPRVDCDVDYEAPFSAWLDAALGAMTAEAGSVAVPALAAAAAGATAPSAASVATAAASLPAPGAPTFGRKNPFPAALLRVHRLNAADSAKEVNHIELSLAGSGLSYEVGDALGVVPQNCPALVDEILGWLGCDGEEPVSTSVGERSLRVALSQHVDLGRPTPELLELLGIADGTVLQVIDALAATTKRADPALLVNALRKLQPRLYSISSSPRAHPNEVHLTVGAVRYVAAGRARKGVCSTFLAERAAAAGQVGVFVHTNGAFRLPADRDRPVIMIGPGTGIAPFRAFLEERAATGARGHNWLFFGDQHAATDFLYQAELEQWLGGGVLHRLDTAFSRDQAEKIYVQHRMLERAAELWRWLEDGAHLYVCGDAARMAKDVDAALHQVIRTAGGRSEADAAAYVNSLRAAKRYARDVY